MGSISKVPYPTPSNSLQWAEDLNYILGAPNTPGNVGVWEAMANAETPTGFGLNPGGNTQTEPGSTPVPGNSAGVQEYSSWATSLAAYESVVTQSNNRQFLADLRGGNASEQTLANDLVAPGASWAGGLEAKAPVSMSTFKYNGPAGSASGTGQDQGFLGNLRHDIAGAANATVNAPAKAVATGTDAVSSALTGAFSGVINPLVGDLKRDIYDWAFVVFGLALIVVGLVVTFRNSSSNSTPIIFGGGGKARGAKAKAGGADAGPGDAAAVAEA
jgi:hypothetical protein